MKPRFLNLNKKNPYLDLNFSFDVPVYWWRCSLDHCQFFDLIDKTEFLNSMLNEGSILIIDHSTDPIKLEQFISLYYEQVREVFESNNIDTNRIIVLEPSLSFQFYSRLSPVNYTKIHPRIQMTEKFSHIFFNSVFLIIGKKWKDSIISIDKNPTHHFLSLSRADKFHRRYMNYALHTHNLFDKGLISHARVDSDWSDGSDYINELKEKSDFVIDDYLNFGFLKHILDNGHINKINSIENYLELSNKVCFELVLESNVGDYLEITEKIKKPLMGKTPFLLLSSPYSLKYLHTLGFETFDCIFDESYDTELIFYDRVQIIIENLKRMCRYSLSECHKQIQQAQEICDFNHKHLLSMDLTFDINNKINNKIREILNK